MLFRITLQDYTGNSALPPPDLSVEMMPTDKFQPNSNYVQVISAIYFVMAYAPFVSFICALTVGEKEKKISESMQMMGLHDGAKTYVQGRPD